MQKLAEICIRRPVFASMIILALVVVGAASYFRLGVDRFPSVDLPNVSVRTTFPGASPEEVETMISQPIEEVVNTVEGIDELRSISGQGTSFVMATFNLDRDIDVAAQDVRDRVATVLKRLPDDVEPPIISKFNNEDSPILTIAVSGDRSLRELTEIADKIVKVQLERSVGVGEVRLVGGLERAINIWIDADRLAAYQIPITAVRDAIQRQNADIPGGNVTSGAREQVLRTMGRITDPGAFNELVITSVNGSPIRIRDIGRAEDGTKEQRSLSRLNGVPTVQLQVRRQSGANTVEVIESVKENLARVTRQLPADVKTRNHPRPVALHLRRAARNQRTSRFGQHSGDFGRVGLHAQLALHGDQRGSHSGFGDLDFRYDVGARLHPEQRHDAGSCLDGGHCDRRCHRRSGKHLPFRRRKTHEPFRGRTSGDRRNRFGGHGDDLQSGGDLRSGCVHVEHLGTVPLSVRPHGGGGGLGQLVGLVYTDADDERALAPRRGRDVRRRAKEPTRGVAFMPGSTVTTSACSAGPWPTASRSW